jgi:hypothetical protein
MASVLTDVVTKGDADASAEVPVMVKLSTLIVPPVPEAFMPYSLKVMPEMAP